MAFVAGCTCTFTVFALFVANTVLSSTSAIKVVPGCKYRNQTFTSVNCLSQHIKQRQCDQYLQIWRSNMSLSSRGKTYQIYKDTNKFRKIFNLLPDKLWKPILKFRTSNHYLPIETGRWNKIPLEDRICTLCNKNYIADEFHYLLKCQFFNHPRTQFLHPYYYKTKYL